MDLQEIPYLHMGYLLHPVLQDGHSLCRHPIDGLIAACYLPGGELSPLAEGRNAPCPEDLVGVGVADANDECASGENPFYLFAEGAEPSGEPV